MATHELKTWPTPFQAVVEGRKTYEIRSNGDRAFVVGDELVLREWVPAHEDACSWKSPFDEQQTEYDDFFCTKCNRKKREPLPGQFTMRETRVEVTYVTPGGKFGLPPDLCVMSITPMKKRAERQIVKCIECKSEYVELIPNGAYHAGWLAYRESNPEGNVSPIIYVCPKCAETPFKLRYFPRPNA